MRIRWARADDAATIAEVHVRSWRAAYRGLVPQEYLDGLDPHRRRAVWERRLAEVRRPASGMLVAEDAGGIVGFSGFRPTPDADEDPAAVAKIGTLYSVLEVWGTGVGRRLMAAVTDAVQEGGYRQATLWVLEGNARARRFYAAAGWRPDGAVEADEIGGLSITKLRYRRRLGGGSPPISR